MLTLKLPIVNLTPLRYYCSVLMQTAATYANACSCYLEANTPSDTSFFTISRCTTSASKTLRVGRL